MSMKEAILHRILAADEFVQEDAHWSGKSGVNSLALFKREINRLVKADRAAPPGPKAPKYLKALRVRDRRLTHSARAQRYQGGTHAAVQYF